VQYLTFTLRYHVRMRVFNKARAGQGQWRRGTCSEGTR
jgi:hypothetical protein